jgi:valyl-tRNA synthetase
MPYITEEIWQSVHKLAGKTGDTIMLQPYPEFDAGKINTAAEADIAWLQKLILIVRNIRGEMNISPGKKLAMLLQKGSEEDRSRLKSTEVLLRKLANLENVRWLQKNEEPPFSATGLAGDLEVMIPMAGLIDVKTEVKRLNKEVEKLETESSRLKGKLSNQKFVSNAPAAVVDAEKKKLLDIEQALASLHSKVDKVSSLSED